MPSSAREQPAPGAPKDEWDRPQPSRWHALSAAEALDRLGADPSAGLTTEEARKRLAAVGPNRYLAERQVTFWRAAREEIAEPMILLLLAVGFVYALWGELLDAFAIFSIITGIVFVEVYNEYRAKAAIASLQRLAAPVAPVVRDGSHLGLPADELVPGDLVLLRPGERVPADVRLVESTGLRIDESSLTGESAAVVKSVEPVDSEAELADRTSVAHAGTLVTAGKGVGVVFATGLGTEIGRIAGLVRLAREPRTPLQVAMRQLSGWLVWVAVGFSVLVPALGFLFGQPPREMVLTGLTLAFATIPEEMPILITVVLGLGALRLSRRSAIVKRLRAAETLGSVSVIATDKTGTITENRMALAEVRLSPDGASVSPAEASASPEGRRLLEIGTLANDARVSRVDGHETLVGDPTDTALLAAGRAAGVDGSSSGAPVEELAFDERRRMASAVYRRGDTLLVAAKGAPEAILARCGAETVDGAELALSASRRADWLRAAEDMAERGLRTLALAHGRWPLRLAEGEATSPSARPLADQVEADLVLAGLVGLADPPRSEAAPAIAELRSAGIRVLMLTGDHPATARAIARQVGIGPVWPSDDRGQGQILQGRDLDSLDDAALAAAVGKVAVFARIAPEHKLRIVRALQAQGEVVAVTGDGVNDAPALREAAIGVAMGETGTDVAKEAAGMVLADDNFATIAVAVREGRKLFENLRKAVRYYLAAKVALVASSLVAVLAQLPVPFAPVQMILMELFMDLGASVTFTTEPAEGDVMTRPPRDPRQPFVDRGLKVGILAGGLSLGAAVILVYLWSFARGATAAHAQTAAFATWMLGHVILALQMRSERQPIVRRGLASNRGMALWGSAAVVTLALVESVPALWPAVKVTPLSLADWAMAAVAPIVTTSWWEVWRLARLRWAPWAPRTARRP